MNTDQTKFLVLLVVIGFLPTLGFYYVGEEAIFPITSLEMWHRQAWIQQPLFGINLKHNPLFNWLIIPVAALVGWDQVLQAARAITVAATLATGAMAGWLAFRLLRDRGCAWFVALLYLTLADVLFYRGWLAYVDPLFGFFVFAALAMLWVACEERRPALLAWAVVSLTLAFMSKALTAYVFYGSAVLVLLFTPQYRRVLLSLPSLVLHAAAALAPFLWLASLPANSGQGGRMFAEIIAKLVPQDLLGYLQKLGGFSAETVWALAPAIFLAAWFAWGRGRPIFGESPHLRIASGIALVSYLPYWLAPHSALRYLVPIYPMIAFALALILWRAGERALVVTRHWLTGMIAVKLVAAIFLFPYYQSHYRGENYARTAQDIIELTAGHPLYATDVSASGLSVAGYIDAWRYPLPPLRWMPEAWDTGFVITLVPNPAIGNVARHYRLGGNDLYVLCRGSACQDQPKGP